MVEAFRRFIGRSIRLIPPKYFDEITATSGKAFEELNSMVLKPTKCAVSRR